ncbi:metallophosphoesterase [Corynebacterium sp. 335C]
MPLRPQSRAVRGGLAAASATALVLGLAPAAVASPLGDLPFGGLLQAGEDAPAAPVKSAGEVPQEDAGAEGAGAEGSEGAGDAAGPDADHSGEPAVPAGDLSPAPAAPSDEAQAAETASRIVISPLADASTAVYVSFLLPARGATVEYRPAGGGETASVPADAAPGFGGYHHTATIEGLAAGSGYEYRIVPAGEPAGPWYAFDTAQAGFAPSDIIFFGDAQNGLDTDWPVTARAAFAGVPDADLLLQTGDQIDVALDDGEWADYFSAMDGVPATTQMLHSIGNHEYTDASGQAFRNHFEHPKNGPAPIQDSTYYVDHQGVRIISLSANSLFYGKQAAFLDEALESNPHQWSIVMFHQPVFNGSDSRNDPKQFEAFGEIIERHDVDLVLNGHDHTYARGHMADNNKGDGTSDGPVYVLATAGEKFYDAGPENRSWSDNGADRVVWAQELSTYQHIEVDSCRLELTAHITLAGDDPKSSSGVTEGVLDNFTIDKCGEGKVVR